MVPFILPLTNCPVLEYFSTSPFYDRQSNNQVLKMQSQFTALGLGDLNQRLSLMRGVEFVVHAEYPPDMWIIRKQRRNSPEDGTNLNDPNSHDLLFQAAFQFFENPGKEINCSVAVGVLFCGQREYLSFFGYLLYLCITIGTFPSPP